MDGPTGEATYKIKRPRRGLWQVWRNGVHVSSQRTEEQAQRSVTSLRADDEMNALLKAHPERKIDWS